MRWVGILLLVSCGGVSRHVVVSPAAPAAIGPYSQAIAVQGGRTVYTAGQIGIDPETGQLVDGGVREQTVRVLDNLGAVLAAAGVGFEHVVSTTIFVADLSDYATVNEIYAVRFSDAPPARATVQVAGIPAGALVEISMIAVGP